MFPLFAVARGMFEDQVAFLATLGNTGLVTPMHVRTCWLDDCVETFVRGLGASPPSTLQQPPRPQQHEQTPRGTVVILGSGFDTRCYRLGLREQNIQLFEVGTTHELDYC